MRSTGLLIRIQHVRIMWESSLNLTRCKYPGCERDCAVALREQSTIVYEKPHHTRTQQNEINRFADSNSTRSNHVGKQFESDPMQVSRLRERLRGRIARAEHNSLRETTSHKNAAE